MKYLLFITICFSAILSSLPKLQIGPFSHTSMGWLLPLFVAIIVLGFHPKVKLLFPVKIWIPWFTLVLIHIVIFPETEGLQRFIMLFSPILFGVIFASLKFTGKDHDFIVIILKILAVSLIIIRITGSIFNLNINIPGLVMVPVLLITFFTVLYGKGEKKYLFWIGILLLIPIIGINRMAILSSFIPLLFLVTHISGFKRIILIIVFLIAGFLVFNSDSFQQKMFYSGQGSFSTFVQNPEDIRTHGRLVMWIPMMEKIKDKPILGHGHNQSTHFISNIISWIRHPHNDYLRILFDYGYLGLLIYLLTLIWQMVSLKIKLSHSKDLSNVYLRFGFISFFPFLFLMITGNPILYVAYYGNLQFALIGIGYSMNNSKVSENHNNESPFYS